MGEKNISEKLTSLEAGILLIFIPDLFTSMLLLCFSTIFYQKDLLPSFDFNMSYSPSKMKETNIHATLSKPLI